MEHPRMQLLSQVTEATKTIESLHSMFGMASIGLITFIVVMVVFAVMYIKIYAPMRKDDITSEQERTKQAEAMKQAAESLERAQLEVKQTAQIQAATTRTLTKLVDRILPPSCDSNGEPAIEGDPS